MNQKSKQALGVFAKEPVAGRVKTRLCPPLAPTQAAELYEVSLRETIAVMGRGDFDLILFPADGSDWFAKTFPNLRRIPQRGNDLGERMATALKQLLRSYDRAALIGSDSPDLPLALVERAFNALCRNDMTLIPSRDGGYVLVGTGRHHPELFHNIPWSTPEVLTHTRRRASDHSISLREIGEWEDLDDLPSLQRLVRRASTSQTATYAHAHLGHLL